MSIIKIIKSDKRKNTIKLLVSFLWYNSNFVRAGVIAGDARIILSR